MSARALLSLALLAVALGGCDGHGEEAQDQAAAAAPVEDVPLLWMTGTGLSQEPSRSATLAALRRRALAAPGVDQSVCRQHRGGLDLGRAAAVARRFPGDGPHLVYLPERTFSIDSFLADVKAMPEAYQYSLGFFNRFYRPEPFCTSSRGMTIRLVISLTPIRTI